MSSWPQDWAQLVPTPPSLSPPSRDTALGCLDEFALVLEGDRALGWFVRGWAALADGWDGLGELRVRLHGSRCSFQAPLAREPRDDVARAYARPELCHVGFRALLPATPLPDGDYRVIVDAYRDERAAQLDTGLTLNVQAGLARLPALEQERLLQVVHVPKTAGTSFRDLLERAFGSGLVQHYAARRLLYPQTRCIQGHTYASNFLGFAPNLRLAMWFRDPVERVVSEYFHWRRNPDTHPLDGEGLLDFARRLDMVNVHRRCLDGVPLARLDYIGITEQFEASIELFCRLFDVPAPPLEPQNTNPDKLPGARYSLPDALREQIALAHVADIELYEQAKQRFSSLCRQHGVAL